MSKQLAPDETIITNFSRLKDSSKYGRNVLRKMRACLNDRGSAFVKIGVTGSGQKPCYRIIYLDDSGVEQIDGSYWDMGDELATEDAINQNWSSALVSYVDLESFLKEALMVKGAVPKI